MTTRLYVSVAMLNLQLLMGFVHCYGYLHRHLIVDHVLVFTISVIVCSNILFCLFKPIKNAAIKAFLAILIAAFFMLILFITVRQHFIAFELDVLLVLLLGVVLKLLLFISTPLFMVFELFCKYAYRDRQD